MDRLSSFALVRFCVIALSLALAACAANPARTPAPASTEVASPASADANAVPATQDASAATSSGIAPASTSNASAAQTASSPAATTTSDNTPRDPLDMPTQAEQDYDAIYGAPEPYNPVADSTLPPAAQLPSSYDPWEKWNRKVHRFNNAVDAHIAKPLAKAYMKVVPRPVRLGVSNFFNNLGQPVTMVNALLQGRPKEAGASFGRFIVNSTIGVLGLFDPASRINIPNQSEDFGQTLGLWGWKRSRYVELPLFGPRTVRDTFGLVGDAPLAPLRYVEEDKVRIPLQGLQLVDIRTQLMAVDSMREGAPDDYALVRDAWMQRRNYQIFGDSKKDASQDSQLPEYLQEDQSNPTTPVDVMPYVPEVPVR